MSKYPLEIESVGDDTYIVMSRGHHDLGAELIAPELLANLLAALSAQQSAHVSVPRELLEDLRDCANECYNHARFRGTSGLDTYERLTEEADALLNGGEA